MAPLDTLTLPDLSEEAPAGRNLELDADFGALERATQGKPEIQYGSTVEPAKPPDWKEAEALAQSLMGRTRDLRVMAHLAVARLHLAGLPGFAEVLGQIRSQLDSRWEQVHPQLDPEDDLDPMQRANALFQLRDPAKVLRPLRDLPLARSPRTGPVSWRDIAVFHGALEAEPGRERLTEAVIRGSFADTDPANLQELHEALDRALAEAKAIPAVFDAHAGSGSGPDLTELSKLLAEMLKELARYEAAARDAAQAALPRAEDDAAPADATPGAATDAASQAPRAIASVRSITAVTKRDDALHMLDLSAAYFRAHEPSSPIPLLIDRARRLATMDFLDILRDLAPDGLGQAQVVAGPPSE